MKYGTKVWTGHEFATIGRWNRSVNGPRIPGFEVVKFMDGQRALMHADRLTVAA